MSRDGEAGSRIEAFIARWQGREGGQERANYQSFLNELCAVIGVGAPEPAAVSSELNDYVYERAVRGAEAHPKRIDLYKRGCFILEAKQSVRRMEAAQLTLFGEMPANRGKRGAERGWDVMMQNARHQAENYARLLPADHPWPPFILVCDVGHVIQVFADFSGQGRNYDQFPDRSGYRVYLEDLRDPAIRERLRLIWTDPHALDPALHTARVTRDIAARIAAVAKSLEAREKNPQRVAMFLLRCLFTMFAEDIGLLPEKSFQGLLARCADRPDNFVPMVSQLWEAMNAGGFAYAIETKVRRFNGEFFRDQTVLALEREEIGELAVAASRDWRDVDPAIFGTLLEQALDAEERKRLGAHYTPRAYVERLVVATIIEPLRDEWREVVGTVAVHQGEGRADRAVGVVRDFHARLCGLRVLDPACGTGNFLYVALELLKKLEGEVLEMVLDLGGQSSLATLEGQSVDPHQFLGLEVNPRAAGIAELVLWIGYLQWYVRTVNGFPGEPILRAFHNIEVRDAVLEARDPVSLDFSAPRVPVWPEADFIVGNPPFIGGSLLRARLGDAYTEALWRAHPAMNESADFVMYWWDHAAGLLTAKGSRLRRFGFVTTNSITQVFQRRVVARHLAGKAPVSLVFAIADHPWTRAAPKAAAVRIAMTVVEVGTRDGVLLTVSSETGLNTDAPEIVFDSSPGRINADLTIGVDTSMIARLTANKGIAHDGVKLHGSGFIVAPDEAGYLGLGRVPGLERYIRDYRNGRDLAARPRGKMVIDLFGLSEEQVRRQFPSVYQHLIVKVKSERKKQFDKSPTKDAESYLENWWIFGKPRQELRPALADLRRYIATVDTAKHRLFQFLDANIICDDKLVVIASADSFYLGVLSSNVHVRWTAATGAKLEDRPVYVKSRCFDPFPFPDPPAPLRSKIGNLAEEIDELRKRVLADHAELTLTGLYNVREKLRAGEALDEADRAVFDAGLVGVLHELHVRLDAAVAEAYGLAADAAGAEILAHLVALNASRAGAEMRGEVRWLRPEYQVPRFGSAEQKRELDLEGGALAAKVAVAEKRRFPARDVEQTAAVMAALRAADGPIDAGALARRFTQGRRIVPQAESILAALAAVGLVTQGPGGYGVNW